MTMNGFWIAVVLFLIAFADVANNHSLVGSAIRALDHFVESK